MPPRVTYWTGVWAPGHEALSKQVAELRDALSRRSPIVSFSAGQRSALVPRDRVFRLSGRRGWTLRALAATVEPQGDVTHAVGSIESWHFLRVLGRRPILLTLALPGRPLEFSLYDRVHVFAAETNRLAADVRALGIERHRIQVIHPAIDLTRYRPVPPPPGPFRLVFASTPADPQELEWRGIPLLIGVARRLPDVEILVPWRHWDFGVSPETAMAELPRPDNFKLVSGNRADMAAVYGAAHATICAFASGFGKACPNSVVEGLACGRPAVVTETCGIADLIDGSSAGVVARRTADDIAQAIETLRARWSHASRQARALAERCFDRRNAHRRYSEIYNLLAAPTSRPGLQHRTVGTRW